MLWMAPLRWPPLRVGENCKPELIAVFNEGNKSAEKQRDSNCRSYDELFTVYSSEAFQLSGNSEGKTPWMI